jgi:ribose transport system ATP-binding protein
MDPPGKKMENLKKSGMSNKRNILELKKITKIFPGVVALDSVDLDIEEREVHVLVGENGAGKSSLIKILCGIYYPDKGEITYAGSTYKPRTPTDALRAGIRVVYQEFNLLSYLSVAENIFFEKLPQRAGLVDYHLLYEKTNRLLEMVGLDISPKMPVELLGIAQMQLIEIAKALSSESRVLILDEPTATLTSKEINTLFRIIERLKAANVTIIYISHRLQEIFEIGDRVTVLRNGLKVGTRSTSEVIIPEIVSMMVGKSMEEEYPFDENVKTQEVILKVKNLKYKGNPHAVSFSVRKGELLGIAGLVGSGRTETMRAIFGADPKDSGKIYLEDNEISIRKPRDAVGNGICLLTEDRKDEGLILDMPCYVNITITDLAQVSQYGLLENVLEKSTSKKLVDDLGIKMSSLDQWVRNLSGGNQQKVVLAKWLFRDADVLIFDEPTRGIDVGAKYEIYLLLWKLATLGKAIILVSSDLPELLGICHRILVFSNGKITGEVDRKEFNQQEILSMAYQEYIKTIDSEQRDSWP